jgi:hypothetical protein
MEVWSEFIHEEIFLIEGKAKKQSITPTFKLGVIAPSLESEDEELLASILKATKLDSGSITRKEMVTGDSTTWLVFAESFNHNGQAYTPTKKINHESVEIILAHPLSTLRSSQKEKGELWGILKVHFNL